jgi:hypothetical protein
VCEPSPSLQAQLFAVSALREQTVALQAAGHAYVGFPPPPGAGGAGGVFIALFLSAFVAFTAVPAAIFYGVWRLPLERRPRAACACSCQGRPLCACASVCGRVCTCCLFLRLTYLFVCCLCAAGLECTLLAPMFLYVPVGYAVAAWRTVAHDWTPRAQRVDHARLLPKTN